MDNTARPSNSFLMREGRVHPVWRAFLYIIAYFLSLFVVQVPFALLWIGLATIQGRSGGEIAAQLQAGELSLSWLLPLSVLQLLAVIAITYLFRRFIDRQSFESLGFARSAGWIAEALLGFGLGLSVMAFIFAVEWAGGWATIKPTAAPLNGLAFILTGYVVMYIAVGGAEELMFRGYLLQTLQEWPGTLAAVIISSLVFGVFHACNPSVNPLALVHLILAGLVFAYAYLVTRRLWLPIGFHFAWNFFQGPVFGFPVSGVPAQGLFSVNPTGPALITGGPFGPEGGLTGLCALAVALLVIGAWARFRRQANKAEETIR